MCGKGNRTNTQTLPSTLFSSLFLFLSVPFFSSVGSTDDPTAGAAVSPSRLVRPSTLHSPIVLARIVPRRPPANTAANSAANSAAITAARAATTAAAAAAAVAGTVTVHSMSMSPLWRSKRGTGAGAGGGINSSSPPWAPLKWRSCRSTSFTEEVLTWQIGVYTLDGVLITSFDPLTGEWMGQLLAIAEVASCVCVLTSQMELFVFNMATSRKRRIKLTFDFEDTAIKEQWRSQCTIF